MKKYFKIIGIVLLVEYFIALIGIFILIINTQLKFLDWILIISYLFFGPALALLFLDYSKRMENNSNNNFIKQNPIIIKEDNKYDCSFPRLDKVVLKFNYITDLGIKISQGAIGIIEKFEGEHLIVKFTVRGRPCIIKEKASYFIKK